MEERHGLPLIQEVVALPGTFDLDENGLSAQANVQQPFCSRTTCRKSACPKRNWPIETRPGSLLTVPNPKWSAAFCQKCGAWFLRNSSSDASNHIVA